jgi:hypothetical protein
VLIESIENITKARYKEDTLFKIIEKQNIFLIIIKETNFFYNDLVINIKIIKEIIQNYINTSLKNLK